MKKRIFAVVLAAVMTVTAVIPMGLLTEGQQKVMAAEASLSNPRIKEASAFEDQDTITWDCIWFGSYPKSEVTSEDSVYTTLQNSSEWENGELTVDGIMYRRLNGYDVTICRGTFPDYTSVQPGRRGTYQWTNKEEYHYFRYEPIKWRVLQVENNKALLLADGIVDCKAYGLWTDAQVWENSFLRSWLNGYSGETNLEKKDCTEDNFIHRAFNRKEQKAIFTTHVLNEDNIEYGTDGGNDTDDKIFFLSEREATNKEYGFDSSDNREDLARRAREEVVTMYARVMGTSWSTSTGGYTEDQEIKAALWFLRSPANGPGTVRVVYERGFIKKDSVPNVLGVGVRPAICLDLSDTSLYSYAGTVDSNGNVQEAEAPQIPGKQDLTIAQLPNVSGITCGQSLAKSSLSGGRVVNSDGMEIEGSWKFTDTTITPQVSDSGKTSYEIQFLPEDHKVYNRLKAEVTVEVARIANPPVTIPSGTSLNVGYAQNKKVGDIDLSEYYPGWSWREEFKDISLKTNEAVSVQAVYEDTVNYENTTAVLTVIMSPCSHKYSQFVSDGNATCERDGTMTAVCSICGNKITAAESGSKLGHNYQITESREPTCTTDGKVVKTCKNCKDSYTETTKAYGHCYETTKYIKPTCTEQGILESVCSNCGDVERIEMAASGHSYSEFSVTEEATCQKKGLETRTCSICKYQDKKEIPLKDHTLGKYVEPAQMNKDGSIESKCKVCGTSLENTTIYALKSVKISTTAYVYNGNVKKPSVTVKDRRDKTLKNGTHYTVSYSSGRKNVGKYTVTVKFRGNYKGTVKKTFTIRPKSTSISKISAKKKGFSVAWKKQTSQTSGYQIQYSTDKKFKGSTTKSTLIKTNKTTSKSIAKLKGSKTYYVRVRTYKTVKVNGKNTNIYSDWSKVKNVKTKR